MERQYFDWVARDMDWHSVTFYDVTLKTNVGKYVAGTKFDIAEIDYDNETLTLSNICDDEDETRIVVVAQYEIRLSVNLGK